MKGLFEVKALIEALQIVGARTTAPRNSPTTAGIDVSSGLPPAEWLVGVEKSTTGHAIRVHINILLSIPSFNLHTNHLPLSTPLKSLRLLIVLKHLQMGSTGGTARLPMLRED
jgi:hypothetical protein